MRRTRRSALPRASRRLCSLALGCAISLFAASAPAALATYQQGALDPFLLVPYTGTEDAFLFTNGGPAYFFSRSDNTGTRTDMGVGNAVIGSDTEAPRRIVLRFDVTSLAGQYTSINSVTLRLHLAGIPTGANTARLFQMAAANAAWSEGSGCCANGYGAEDFGGVTWQNRVQGSGGDLTGTPWAGGGVGNSAGAGVAGTDYLAAVLASASWTGSTPSGTTLDFVFGDLSMLSAWVGGSNAGLLLRAIGESGTPSVGNFHSSESLSLSERPELIIDYTPIPEPGSLGLIVTGGGIGLLVRRRRRTGQRPGPAAGARDCARAALA